MLPKMLSGKLIICNYSTITDLIYQLSLLLLILEAYKKTIMGQVNDKPIEDQPEYI